MGKDCNNIDRGNLLKIRQGYALDAKIELSKIRIREWYEHWGGLVYVAFSGGKDSTVLLHLVRSIYPEVPAVFLDTGLEYPEIKDFVRSINNVIWLKPKMSYRQVIEKYGYPVISKEQSDFISDYRNTKSEKLKSIRWNGNKWGRGKISKKWRFLVDAPFKISEKCCDVLKKRPAIKHEKESGNKSFMGTTSKEGALRSQRYIRYGCNAFDIVRPSSWPLSFWVGRDIWGYIRTNGIFYSKIYDKGYTNTGCMWCMFGVHLEKNPNRFQRMKNTHPKIYNYCINKMELGKVLDTIGVEYG